jgi:hypothetical protein
MRLDSPSVNVVSRELVVSLDVARAAVPRRVRERFEPTSEMHSSVSVEVRPSSNDERAMPSERNVKVGERLEIRTAFST